MWYLSAGMKHGVSVFNVLTAAFCRKREDFSQPKIVWSRLMRLAKNDIQSFPRFASVPEGIVTLDSLCFFIGKDIEYLLDALNSEYASYYFFGSVATLDNGGFQMRQQYVENILIPPPGNSNLYEKFNFTDDEISFIKNTVLKRKHEILKDLARNNQT